MRRVSLLLVLGQLSCLAARGSEGEAALVPGTLIYDGAALARAKQAIDMPGNHLRAALSNLEHSADSCLRQGPWTVVSKKLTPPSKDKHDYMSVGPYWWPDPKKADGLPYIRRDGQVNPERHDYDNVGLANTARNSLTLALAWFYTEKPEYARLAAKLLRTWFLDPETRMNPNLNFGQAIPGRNNGRDIGIIDTTCLIQAVDAALILELSNEWSQEDAKALRGWFTAYLDWLRTSPHGKGESKKANNHGTWYDVQVVSFGLYTGQAEFARGVLKAAASRRIGSQIQPDGTQPHELKRTRSWDYSIMNLRGFFTLAALGRHVDVDLWRYRSEDGAGLRRALVWLLPFATGHREWEHKQIKRLDRSKLAPLLRRAAIAYGDPVFEDALGRAAKADQLADARFQLEFPKASNRR